MRIEKLVISELLCLVFLMGCNPSNYESKPVIVDTPLGNVVCQLYTKERLDWDRSISRPDAMTPEVADAYCHAQGRQDQERALAATY